MDNKLWNELKNTVLYDGHFKLTSGNHSDKYFNKDLLWLYPRLREKLISELRDLLLNKYAYNELDFIMTAPATAGSLWACAVARMFGKPFIYCEKNDKGEMIFRRGFEDYIKDNRFIIIEDVITTGKSLKSTMHSIFKNGGHVEAYFCIWDRRGDNPHSVIEEKAHDYDPSNCPFCEQRIPLTSFK